MIGKCTLLFQDLYTDDEIPVVDTDYLKPFPLDCYYDDLKKIIGGNYTLVIKITL